MKNKKKDFKTTVNLDLITKEQTQQLIGGRGTLPCIEQDNIKAGAPGRLHEEPIYLY